MAAHERGTIEYVGEHAVLLQGRAVKEDTALIRFVEFGHEARSWVILVPDGINFYKARATIPARSDSARAHGRGF